MGSPSERHPRLTYLGKAAAELAERAQAADDFGVVEDREDLDDRGRADEPRLHHAMLPAWSPMPTPLVREMERRYHPGLPRSADAACVVKASTTA